MIIKEGDIILIKKPVQHCYEVTNQADLDAMKQVWDFESEVPTLLSTKDTITLEWEVSDIQYLAGKHIEASYPLWKQANVSREGGVPLTTMTTFIDKVRSWSNTDPLPDPWDLSLEAITP